MPPSTRSLLEHLAVIVAYTLLTVLLTYPGVFRISTHLFGDGGDTNIFVWNLWWIKKALMELHTNPYWTDYLYYPEGASLVIHNLVPFNSLLGIPLQALVGLITAINIIALLAFVLSGYGTYLLIRYLVPNRLPAFIGGVIFAFCPYKFAHLLGHFGAISTQWLPFYVLALLRLISGSKREGIGTPVWCAIFLLLVAFCDYFYLIYALIFTALLAVYRFRTYGAQTFLEQDYHKFAKALGLFLIGFAPILIMAGIDLMREGHVEVRGWGGATSFQADLLSFIIPSPLHPLLGSLVQPIASRFKGNLAEATVFTGYLSLSLGLVAAAKLRSTEPWVRFWSFALVVFFILSLGPFPRVLGKGIKVIPLPYHLIMRTPILNNLRIPSRFAIMVMLCLAVLAAFSCDRLLGRFESNVSRVLVFLGIGLTIAFEYLAIPFPMFRPSAPSVYQQIAEEPGPFTVLEIPLGRNSGVTKGLGEFPHAFLFYQTVHEKKLIGGHLSRVPDWKIQALASRPLLRRVLELQQETSSDDVTGALPNGAELDDLSRLQVRYIIIHPPYDRSRARDYVEATLPVAKISEENGVVAFQVIRNAVKTLGP